MGNREALLAGAKRCIVEKGYAHTTARDIVAASGTNLASIGYHFGSKDALLDAAMLDSFDDWDEDIEAALAAQPDGAPTDRLAAFLDVLIEKVRTDRAMVAAGVQWVAQVQFSATVREQLALAFSRARGAFAATLLGVADGEVDDDTARRVGSLMLALVNGVVLQALVDPDRAPSGADVAEALRAVVAAPAGSDSEGLCGAGQ
ncbi:MAG TPA: TetR/AcrR family transcriptional regulator [Pseudonocardia sp.]|jgi:AcrR family transcriptional regulator|uniref:TetR/AcrR family transcriptional regulator n=1 Tax=Pseudonocardia sp. TaxID=60912 RepID=UPI002B4AAF9C|nr:TetR/AcrR family transcriptional regulator [Pseudonocardia sp.]HLU53959.1 TetR/AcrR family transcriptional regulator [Pseudonocardia sp.]